MTQLGTLLNDAGLYNGDERKRRLARAKKSLNTIIAKMMTTDKKTDKYRRLKSEHREVSQTIRDLTY